ncbi:hypothetical protein [Microbacterium sp. KR10-403]|uniref:hypothetical protein n=1 Tax=Microbacterium sp. KR10-403 TaxID=3158581 RepID=UPI0032E47A62
MQELAGRLTALDPDASESLKVIAYFDALVANGVGVEALVRAAAVLAGVPAGALVHGRTIRIDPQGRRMPVADAADDQGFAGADATAWPSAGGEEHRVWIERTGAPHANDAMVLDRLELAVVIVSGDRRAPAGSVEVVLDEARSPAERATALARLRLDGAQRLRVIARSGETDVAGGATAVLATEHGLVRAGLVAAEHDLPTAGPVGHAVAAGPDELPAAWRDARIALRLADRRHPVVDAADLGALILLARAVSPSDEPHPDVVALLALDTRTLDLLDELVAAESVRAAASALSMHHSSMQSRHESLTRQLGYDPRTPLGRTRYETARMLARLR